MPLTDDPWLPYNSDGTVDPARAAIPIAVYRHDGQGDLFELPNVRCLWVEWSDGPHPARAAFRYNLASDLAGAPATFEEALSTDFVGAFRVEAGDRLLVRATRPDGGVACLFDGFSLGFGFMVDPDFEGAAFRATGVAVRCWDMPISSAIYRDASTPSNLKANVQTRLDAHFNPDGRPNAVREEYEVGSDESSDRRYPVFIDPLVVRDPPVSRLWTVAMAVRYLLYLNNDEAFVLSPSADDLDALLGAREPKDGVPFDPSDPASYDFKELIVPDLPATGKDWPNAVHQLVCDCGFSTQFRLATTGDGLPETQFGIYRPQAGPAKSLYLAPRGTPFDPTLFNFNAADLDRDISDVTNAYIVRGAPVRYEVSVVLAPGFPSQAADGSQASLDQFDKSGELFEDNRDKYRLYVFDETGDGHYAAGSTALLTDVPPLDDVFGAPADGVPRYARRRRPGVGKLITADAKGRPIDASLSIATGYAGPKPGLWDGTGTWQPVADSTWSLLPDRLGIRVDAQSPNAWKVGPSKATNAPYPAGVVKGVESQCGASGAVPFALRLTCVIEADECCQYISDRRDESPLPWRRARLVDARDRLRKLVIHATSEHNDSEVDFADRTDIVARDDEPWAKSEAIALRFATQSGVLEGDVSIPRFTGYYGIGDRIASIQGRGLGLRTDGDPDGLNLVFPVVTNIRWDLDGQQRTTLTLSDAGSHRAPRRPARSGPGRKPWWLRHNSGA